MIARAFIGALFTLALAGTVALANLVQTFTGSGGGGSSNATLAFDATSETGGGNFSSSVSSLTWSHVVDTGAVGNPVLYVAVVTYSGSITSTSTVTYNGNACTETDAITDNIEGNNQETSTWACAAPTQGTHNIVVTLSGTADFALGMAESLTGAAQSSPVDSHNRTLSNSSTSTETINTTVIASGTWLIGFAWNRNASSGTVTNGTGTTIRLSGVTAVGIGDSAGTVGTGTQTLTYNLTASSGPWPGLTIASINHGP
jgi:hypothetical protein